MTLTPSQIQRANRAQWIEHALDGIECFSNSSLTTDQKNGISIQFGVLMDQLDVAVKALEVVEVESHQHYKGDEFTEANDHFRNCYLYASNALEQLKSPPK